MNDEIKTGGSAFPCTKEQHAWFPGMTLRDYFAAKAMQAMIGNELDCTNDALAGRAYVVAEAMLKARER